MTMPDEPLTATVNRLFTVLGYAKAIESELNAAIHTASRHVPSESETRNVRLDLSLRALETLVVDWAKKIGQAYDDLLDYPENIGQVTRKLAAIQTEMAEHAENDSVEFIDYPKLTDEEVDDRIEKLLSLWKWRLSRDYYHPRTREGLLAHEALCLRDKVKGLLDSLKLREGRIDVLLEEVQATRAKLELPHSVSRVSPDDCEREFVSEPGEPPYLRIVSSIRTKTAGAHERVFIWTRGALAGELTMSRDDVEVLCSILGLQPKDETK